mgnify:FL=1|jgi:hypothetical protein
MNPVILKRTKLILGLVSVFLLVGLFISPAAASIDCEISTNNSTVGDALK